MSEKRANNLLARGKGVSGWVTGYYLPRNPDGDEGASIVFYPDCKSFGTITYAVDPETVTACSGMPSMNGDLIFDKDILVNTKSGEAGVVEYSEDDGMFSLMTKDGRQLHFSDLLSTDFRIAGNEIDNPEFLEIV